MSSLRISAGLNKEARLPDTQVVFIGRHKHLKSLSYASVAEKLPGVKEEVFNEAIRQLDSEGGSVPLHLNLAKVIENDFIHLILILFRLLLLKTQFLDRILHQIRLKSSETSVRWLFKRALK